MNIKEWAEKNIKSKYKIEKAKAVESKLIEICDILKEAGEVQDWLLEATLMSVARRYSRK